MASGTPTKPKRNIGPVGSPSNPSEKPKINKPIGTPSTPISTKPQTSNGGGGGSQAQQPTQTGEKKAAEIIKEAQSTGQTPKQIAEKVVSSREVYGPQRPEVYGPKQVYGPPSPVREVYGPPTPSPTIQQQIIEKSNLQGMKTEFSIVGKGGTIIDSSNKQQARISQNENREYNKYLRGQQSYEQYQQNVQSYTGEVYGPPTPTTLQKVQGKAREFSQKAFEVTPDFAKPGLAMAALQAKKKLQQYPEAESVVASSASIFSSLTPYPSKEQVGQFKEDIQKKKYQKYEEGKLFSGSALAFTEQVAGGVEFAQEKPLTTAGIVAATKGRPILSGGAAAGFVATSTVLAEPEKKIATAYETSLGVVGTAGILKAARESPRLLDVKDARLGGSLRDVLNIPKPKREFAVTRLTSAEVIKEAEVTPGGNIKITQSILPTLETKTSRRTTIPKPQKTINVAGKEVDIEVLSRSDIDSTIQRRTTSGFGEIKVADLKQNFKKMQTGFKDFFKFSSKRKEPKTELEVFETTESTTSFSFLKFSELGKSNKRSVDILQGPEYFVVDARREPALRGASGVAFVKANEIYFPKSIRKVGQEESLKTALHEYTHTQDPLLKGGRVFDIPFTKKAIFVPTFKQIKETLITKQSQKDYLSLLEKQGMEDAIKYKLFRSEKKRKIFAKSYAKKRLKEEIPLQPRGAFRGYNKYQVPGEARARIVENFPKEVAEPTTKTGRELKATGVFKDIKIYKTGKNEGTIASPKTIEVPTGLKTPKTSKTFSQTYPDENKLAIFKGLQKSQQLKLLPVRLRREFRPKPVKIQKRQKGKQKEVSDENLVGLVRTKKGVEGVLQSPQQQLALEVFKQSQQKTPVQQEAIQQVQQKPFARKARPIVDFREIKGEQITFLPVSEQGRQIPRESLKPALFSSFKPDIMYRGDTRTGLLPSFRQIPETKPSLKPSTSTRFTPRIDVGFRQTPRQEITTRQDIERIQETTPRITTTGRGRTRTITRTPPPTKITILKPSVDTRRTIPFQPKKTRKKTKRRFAYTPSLIATTFGIKGKSPKALSGLEIRPVRR